MRTRQQAAEIIAELCGKVALLFPQNEIEAILFGSYARGDFRVDSDVDIMTAKNSRMPCISVTWGFRNREFLTKHDAEIIIDSPDEIIDILENRLK